MKNAEALDLSEIRRAEAALQASERRYRSLADALPQIIMLAGPPTWPGAGANPSTPTTCPRSTARAPAAGFAIGNARQYEREHRVSNVFQGRPCPGRCPAA